jgi:hypothetical protein
VVTDHATLGALGAVGLGGRRGDLGNELDQRVRAAGLVKNGDERLIVLNDIARSIAIAQSGKSHARFSLTCF